MPRQQRLKLAVALSAAADIGLVILLALNARKAGPLSTPHLEQLLQLGGSGRKRRRRWHSVLGPPSMTPLPRGSFTTASLLCLLDDDAQWVPRIPLFIDENFASDATAKFASIYPSEWFHSFVLAASVPPQYGAYPSPMFTPGLSWPNTIQSFSSSSVLPSSSHSTPATTPPTSPPQPSVMPKWRAENANLSSIDTVTVLIIKSSVDHPKPKSVRSAHPSADLPPTSPRQEAVSTTLHLPLWLPSVSMDNNLGSIIGAISTGWRMFWNVQRFILHLLATNVGEVILLFIGLVFRDGADRSVSPLNPLGVLWINVVMSSPSAFVLGLEAANPLIMKQPPHSIKLGDVDPPLPDVFGPRTTRSESPHEVTAVIQQPPSAINQPPRVSPEDLYPTYIPKMTNFPTIESVSIENLQDSDRGYGATLFTTALARFIIQYRFPNYSPQQVDERAHDIVLPFRGVPVFHKVKFITPNEHDSENVGTLDSVHAHPCQWTRTGNISKAAQFDTALIKVRDVGQRDGSGLHNSGFRIGRVRVIFSLPSTNLHLVFPPNLPPPKHLAYVKWYPNFTWNPESHSNLYKIKKELCRDFPIGLDPSS
ncbi:hypothetical protein PQX77_004296 [Marasmius sp. AFHP31]|nr:hypothetical protein PQX77_004296 [Marasmius sp. AFHP31]